MTRTSSHMWSQQDPGEADSGRFSLNAHFQKNTEAFPLSARVRAADSFSQRSSPQYCQCECAARSWRQPSNTWVRGGCRTADTRVEAIIHRLNSLSSVSGVKLMVSIAIVLVFVFLLFFFFNGMKSRWCWGDAMFSHPVRCCLLHQQICALWGCTCTPRASADSLDNGFHFYLKTFKEPL